MLGLHPVEDGWHCRAASLLSIRALTYQQNTVHVVVTLLVCLYYSLVSEMFSDQFNSNSLSFRENRLKTDCAFRLQGIPKKKLSGPAARGTKKQNQNQDKCNQAAD